jgi:hypothetical protein
VTGPPAGTDAMTPLLRRIAAPALACAIAVLAAPPARADHGMALLDETLGAYLLVAQAHWGEPAPTCVGVDGQPVTVHAALFDDPNPRVTARGEQPGCRIWLDRDFWPAPPGVRSCAEIAHEWGHLLGHAHTVTGLMAPDVLGAVPGCSVFGRRELRRLARSGSRRPARAVRRCRGAHGRPRPRRAGARARRCRAAMSIRRVG